jgi:phage regulator Rha-like protein
MMNTCIAHEKVACQILIILGRKVMTDSSLAKLYGVKTKSLNLAVKRNKSRFPEDFMFQLTENETAFLRFQIETSKKTRGGRRYLPYVFIEHGVAMLSSVLKSEKAIQVNIAIMRTFAKLREVFASNKELAHKLVEIEQRTIKHETDIRNIFDIIQKLIYPPARPRRQIGFHT